jgi:hypothetical protein
MHADAIHLGSHMLADFRFVLGAILAVTMLAVAGLGVATSVALMREAHIAPAEDSRNLAYAGPVTWNEFYDPDAARRFEGGGKSVQVEPPAMPMEARSLPTNPEIEENKEAEPPHATEATGLAAAVEAPASPVERVASVSATPVSLSEPGPAPLEAQLPPVEVPPQPRPKPQFPKRARPHIRRAFGAHPQAPQFSSPWPPFGNQVGTRYSTQYGTPYGTTTAWRNPFSGPFNNHPR